MPARSRNVKDDAARPTTRTRAKALQKPTTYCVCNQPDDGSPMVQCAHCSEWYHFRCVELSLQQAEDIEVYVCPSCTKSTGRRMIMQWDHPDFIDVLRDEAPPLNRPTPPPALSPDDSEEDPDSEDDYVAEPDPLTSKRSSRRRTRQIAFDSDSDQHYDTLQDPAALKRKSGPSHQPREAKRKKSSDAPVSVDDDPARKYCLGKLRDMFRPVFLRYPHKLADDGSGDKVDLDHTDLTDEDRQYLQNEADSFASHLEQCLFDLYGEPDKHGKQGVGPKYKERFRMLTFNLSQADRVAIHKRICFATITANELSQMSSTDLANEETKQSIKLAEKEALEHSILKKTLIPRAKITHKGLQDIEDVNGESATLLREREKEREKEEERRDEERRERERQARLKAAEQHQRDRTSSISQGSIPPESPILPQSATWAVHRDAYSPPMGDNVRPPLFAPSAIQTSPEPELDIADLIHLDDEPAPQDTSADHDVPAPALETSVADKEPDLLAPPEPAPPPPLVAPPTSSELSPVATASPIQLSKPETPARTSFDLNALWTSPKAELASQEVAKEPEPQPQQPQQQPQQKQQKSQPLVVDAVARETTDQDFDIFLEKDQEVNVAQDERRPDPEAAFRAAPVVWTGKVAMPVDSSIPQLAPVVARQVGGRSLGVDSPLWRTLFPSDTLRIDGRVPTENSAQFLLQTRLNPQKELIACAFSSQDSDDTLQAFSDFLLQKNRHGLVFPWGHHPKDYQPGKELYMVPLLANMPLPDFIELLDDLLLPKVRQNNYVIGIWILVRGKLAPPPLLPTASLPPSVPQPQPPVPAPAPAIPAVLQAYPQLANSALAAEVAALTHEQIQAILRTLSSGNGGIPGISGGLASAVANVAHAPHPPPMAHVHPPMPTAGISSVAPHWPPGGVPGFPVPPTMTGPGAGPSGAFLPAPHPTMPGTTSFLSSLSGTPPNAVAPAGIHQPPSGPRGGGGSGSGGYGQSRYDREDGPPGHPEARYRDERGERGGPWPPPPPPSSGRRARTRGGRGRNSGGDFVGRPVDSGWSRRTGSQSSPGQEDRARWDASPPRRW